MVGQSVSLGVEPHVGLMTRYLLLFDSYGHEPHVGLMTRYLLLFDSYGLVFVGRPL
jgi:hypothetical protein